MKWPRPNRALKNEPANRISDLTRITGCGSFRASPIETRSVIVSTFTSMADCFLRGMLGRLFCTETNFTPEDTFKGKIIIFDLPVKEHNELGQFAQVLFKFVWQRAVERRIPPGSTERMPSRPFARFSCGPTSRSFSPIPTTRFSKAPPALRAPAPSI
jgi:hypothetical protein